MIFELADLEALGAKAGADFKESLRTATQQGQPAFDLAVAELMGKVEFAYGVAARLAHRETTLEGTEALGAKVVSICDSLAAQLRALEADHPSGRASYDRILDYRNAAERRRSLHE
jgi:uncharacterized protein involved in exopolysaccharide biosynthesis